MRVMEVTKVTEVMALRWFQMMMRMTMTGEVRVMG
jgi:hypothetical protein